MLVNIDKPEIESFKPHESINHWYKRSTSKHREGKAQAKQPAHGNRPHEKPGPKLKQTLWPYKTKTVQYFFEDIVYLGLHFALPNSNKLSCFRFRIVIYTIFFCK